MLMENRRCEEGFAAKIWRAFEGGQELEGVKKIGDICTEVNKFMTVPSNNHKLK